MARTFLPPDLASFAKHYFSDQEVDAAVDQYLAERNLQLSDFAKMTEREFSALVDDPEACSTATKHLNHSRVIQRLYRRLLDNDINFLPNQSVYLRSELHCSGPYSSVHRVFVRKDSSMFSLCGRLKRPAAKTVLTFGDVGLRKFCSHCARFDLDRAWHWL